MNKNTGNGADAARYQGLRENIQAGQGLVDVDISAHTPMMQQRKRQ